MVSTYLLPMVLAGALSNPSMPIRATTAEGRSSEGTWSGMTADGNIILAQGEATEAFSPSELLNLRWTDAERVDPPAQFQVCLWLTDGSMLYSTLTGGGSREIEVSTPLTEKLTIPLASLIAIRFTQDQQPAVEAAFQQAIARRDPSQDTYFVLRDGRVTALPGVTDSLKAGGGTFRWRNRNVPIQLDSSYGIVFASGLREKVVPPALCVLRDGSVWGGRIVGGDMESIRLEVPGHETSIAVPVNMIREVRFQSNHVVFLSSLEPNDYEFQPFGTTRWPYRRDRSVANREMRIGDQTFERGIGMHSQSVLTYDLSSNYSQFAAVIGIDEAVGINGNVVFRVLGDGKELFNSGPVTGYDNPRPILVPIEGVKRLQIAVDYGDDLDIGDQANWGNARLIK